MIVECGGNNDNDRIHQMIEAERCSLKPLKWLSANNKLIKEFI